MNVPVAAAKILFHDFSYTDQPSMINHSWIIRMEPGWPGVPNAGWVNNNVSFVADPDQPDNRLLPIKSSTNGTATRQTQFCH